MSEIEEKDEYGDRKAKCPKCKAEITVCYDWLANVYEESIMFYHCENCHDKDWWYR